MAKDACMKRILALSLFALTLAACSGSPRPSYRENVINRALSGAPGQAQPSKIVAREIEFARAAREEGQWTAFLAFSAPGALIHGPQGPLVASTWLAGRANPAEAVQWEPRTIWMSCDGKLAVSQGRFTDPNGLVGNFHTVWTEQPDRQYLWVYDGGAPDNPQPPPRVDVEDGDIVVTSIDAVRTDIAHCPKRGEEMPVAPAVSLTDEYQSGGGISPDGTLQWRWEHYPDGKRRIMVNILKRDGWQNALDETFPDPLG